MRLIDRIAKRLSGGRDAGPSRRLAGSAGGFLRSLFAVVVELLRIAREMVVIPAQLWLAIAEAVGRVVLAAWDLARPVLAAAIALAAAALRAGQRELTPVRAVGAVCLGALVALVASQWVDYRGIGVGTEGYAGSAGAVAPPPDVARERAGDAHAWAMLPLAAGGAVVLAVAIGGRWRAARLLVPLGLAVVAVSLLVDAPQGLDEGGAAVAYQGAEARLLEGFWAQLWAGAVIAGCGLLLLPVLRSAAGAAAGRRGRTRGRRRPGRAALQEQEGATSRSSSLADPPIRLNEPGSPRTG
ncbi:MAG: hypothetical protein ACRDK9_11150 [Solirubrobacterales bacterium]